MPGTDLTDVVARARAELEAAGVSLAGPCGAFAIVQLAAWRQRATGAGLLTKNSGNNCMGFSVDSIVYPQGQLYDVLFDAGGENRPQSIEQEPVDPTRYHGAFVTGVVADLVGASSPAPAPPPPMPTPTPASAASSLLATLERIITALERTATAVDALNTRLDAVKMNGVRVHL